MVAWMIGTSLAITVIYFSNPLAVVPDGTEDRYDSDAALPGDPFPRWTTADASTPTRIHPDFWTMIDASLRTEDPKRTKISATATTMERQQQRQDQQRDHLDVDSHHFHTVYVIDRNWTLWTKQVPNAHSQITQDRSDLMHPMLIRTVQQQSSLFVQQQQRQQRRLSNSGAVQNNNNRIDEDDGSHDALHRYLSNVGPLAFAVNYADSRLCCTDPDLLQAAAASSFGGRGGQPTAILGGNTVKYGVPILTLSAPVHCNHTFPVPTYETIVKINKKTVSYYKMKWFQHVIYPWWNRYRQAVWRGSPTGPTNVTENVRWKLCELSMQYPHLLDAKFVGNETIWPQLRQAKNRGMVVAPDRRMAVRDYQRYRAVIDVDGNSWSARFGGLLCYTAVVFKVQPSDVDYFYPELRPYVHYVPVRADLGDLIAKIHRYLVGDNGAEAIRIVNNANRWCRGKMQESTVVADMGKILNRYAAVLLEEDATASATTTKSGKGTSASTATAADRWLLLYNFTRLSS
jgi:Glycosyl transferase family 90